MQETAPDMTAPTPGLIGLLLGSMVLPTRKAFLALTAGAVASLFTFALLPSESWTQAALLSFALCWASAVDLDRQFLPDVLTLGLCGFGLAYSFLSGAEQFMACSIGVLAGYASFILVNQFYLRLRGRSGLGQGDAKLLAAAGAWLGWSALPYVVIGASCAALGVVVARAAVGFSIDPTRRVAFGPYIALALWTIWLARETGALISNL